MYDELKRQAWEANLLLPHYGLVRLTFGNASVVDREAGVIAIKPSGVAYDELQPADMVVIDLAGNRVEGSLRPSSDTPTHACLYQAFPGIRAVIHTHSRYATAFAQAGLPVPCFGTTHADYFRGDIPVTAPLTPEQVDGEYEWETGRAIAARFADLSPTAQPGVLVRSHGPFAWGASGTRAAENAYAMEILAEMALYSRQLSPGLQPIGETLIGRHFDRKHGGAAYYGQA